MRGLFVVCAALATLVTPIAPALAAPSPLVSTACGTALDATEIDRIELLSDTTTLPTGATLVTLEDAVARHQQITEILVRHRDWRGLFALGLDGVEQAAVMPLQRDPGAFLDREYAHRISLDLLRRFLVNVHAEFGGGTLEPQWATYFDLTRQCDRSPARVAMAGYNAHLTVDLTHAVAAVGTRPENAPDYFEIVDAIARSGDLIVDRTKAVYGADLGPLWRFYFVGEGLDAVVGKGVATGPLLRLADAGANVVIFGNGLALQDPALRTPTAIEVDTLWRTVDLAMETLAELHAL
jgi:Family of unknown function (DUF5995)